MPLELMSILCFPSLEFMKVLFLVKFETDRGISPTPFVLFSHLEALQFNIEKATLKKLLPKSYSSDVNEEVADYRPMMLQTHTVQKIQSKLADEI